MQHIQYPIPATVYTLKCSINVVKHTFQEWFSYSYHEVSHVAFECSCLHAVQKANGGGSFVCITPSESKGFSCRQSPSINPGVVSYASLLGEWLGWPNPGGSAD